MKWPQSGEPLSLIGGCGRGGEGKDWQPSPSAVLFQSPLKYLKQRWELLIQVAKSPFFPKLLPKCWQFTEGLNEAWMVNHLSTLYLQKGMKKAFISSPKIGPTANPIPLNQGRYSTYRSSSEPDVGLQLNSLLIMSFSLLKSIFDHISAEKSQEVPQHPSKYTAASIEIWETQDTVDLH